MKYTGPHEIDVYRPWLGPRHFVFHPLLGNLLYTANEQVMAVVVMAMVAVVMAVVVMAMVAVMMVVVMMVMISFIWLSKSAPLLLLEQGNSVSSYRMDSASGVLTHQVPFDSVRLCVEPLAQAWICSAMRSHLSWGLS